MLRRHSAKLHHLRPGYHLQFYSKKVMSSFQWFAFSITFVLGTFTNIGDSRAVVVVKWSACSPTTLSIRIRIPLKFNSVNCLKKNGNKQKEVGDGPFFVKKHWRFEITVTIWVVVLSLYKGTQILEKRGFYPKYICSI